MTSISAARLGLLLTVAITMSACEDGSKFPLFQKKSETEQSAAAPGQTIERDVESPEVFQVTDSGLWDGRPSLGGVWVAHDDTRDPERVIIRNEANGKSVIGALFKRETSNPGPAIQVSSDAAEALGMLAGAPASLSITALRREEVAVEPEEPMIADAEPIEAQTLDGDPIAAAAAAIDAAEAGRTAGAVTAGAISPPETMAPTPRPDPVAAATPKPASKLSKPFIQIGIFSVEANADRTADMLRKSGVVPTIKPGNSSGKAFWRVVIGPVGTASDRDALIKKVKGLGFADAYAVSN